MTSGSWLAKSLFTLLMVFVCTGACPTPLFAAAVILDDVNTADDATATAESAKETGEDDTRIERLERRIDELEESQSSSKRTAYFDPRTSNWTRFIRLGGSANVGWYDGQANSVYASTGFQVRDARFFVDAEVGQGLEIFGRTVARNAGFSFEWNLVRIGQLANDVGEAYVEVQGVAGSDWLNVQVGRFQLPVGEAYLRYSRGQWKNPFISNPAAGTWWWDEGVKLYGGGGGGLFSYVASITENETAFNASVSKQKQYSLKLITEPREWLRLSVSGLYGGDIGSATSPGSGGGLWIGETWGRGIGTFTNVPVVQFGSNVADGPLNVDSTWFVGADAIFDFEGRARIWLSYGAWSLDSSNAAYDRLIHTWIAEVVLYGGLVTPLLDRLYFGARATGLGTYDPNRGYSYDSRALGQVGYNARSLADYSAVLGWTPTDWMTVRTEYTHRHTALVDGVPAAQRALGKKADSWGIEIGVHF